MRIRQTQLSSPSQSGVPTTRISAALNFGGLELVSECRPVVFFPAVLRHVRIDAGRHVVGREVQVLHCKPFFAMIAAEASRSSLVWLSPAFFLSDALTNKARRSACADIEHLTGRGDWSGNGGKAEHLVYDRARRVAEARAIRNEGAIGALAIRPVAPSPVRSPRL